MMAMSLRMPAPRMDAYNWLEAAEYEVNLLPFGLQEGLLPGETKQVHLFEARFLELFAEAEAKHHGCVSMLLITSSGNVAAITSLLEIEESRRQEIGVWARLRCVGRVRLLEVEQTDYGFARGKVCLVTDSTSEPVDDALLDECAEAHASCRTLEMKIKRSNTNAGSAADERVEWGHEVAGEVGFQEDLPTLRDQRREMLCFRGLDEAPATCLDERIQRLWGAESEADAEAQLLSFSAAGCLDARDKSMALRETDTVERLQAAIASFKETQRRLAAEVALRALSSDNSDDAPADSA